MLFAEWRQSDCNVESYFQCQAMFSGTKLLSAEFAKRVIKVQRQALQDTAGHEKASQIGSAIKRISRFCLLDVIMSSCLMSKQ